MENFTLKIKTHNTFFMKKIFYLFIFTLLFTTVACEQTIENEDVNLPQANLKGEWTVNAYVDNKIIFGPFTVSSQMTSEDGAIYLKDNGEFWNFQVKVDLANSSDSFEANSTINEISSIEAKVTILNGSIINKDSISFDIQFEDDETPYGITYSIKGHRK